MPDTITINGITFGVDVVTLPDGTPNIPVERAKMGWGVDNSYRDVSAIDPLPVALAGAATAANQASELTKLDALASALAGKLQVRQTGIAPPLGYAQATVTAAVVALPTVGGVIPVAAVTALVTPRAPIRWRDDTTDPSATIGMYLAADQPLAYQGSLTAFRMVAVTGSVEVNVSYYGLEA